jgi:hypothetical protein
MLAIRTISLMPPVQTMSGITKLEIHAAHCHDHVEQVRRARAAASSAVA